MRVNVCIFIADDKSLNCHGIINCALDQIGEFLLISFMMDGRVLNIIENLISKYTMAGSLKSFNGCLGFSIKR